MQLHCQKFPVVRFLSMLGPITIKLLPSQAGLLIQSPTACRLFQCLSGGYLEMELLGRLTFMSRTESFMKAASVITTVGSCWISPPEIRVQPPTNWKMLWAGTWCRMRLL